MVLPRWRTTPPARAMRAGRRLTCVATAARTGAGADGPFAAAGPGAAQSSSVAAGAAAAFGVAYAEAAPCS